MKKNKEGCYCKEFPDLGENSEGMLICFNCGIVFRTINIDFSDETIRYDSESKQNSRCNGLNKSSFMSNQNSLSLLNFHGFSSYSSNIMKWNSFTNEDIIILKIKDYLDRKSFENNLNQKNINFILNKYKDLLNIKKTNKDANFKGKYIKGILAVFSYITLYPISKKKACEIFELGDDISTFNKCCKIYKDIFNEEVVPIKYEMLNSLLEEFDIPFKIQTLIHKGYVVCIQFDILKNIYSKKIILSIIFFFLKELNYDVDDILNNKNYKIFFKSKFLKENLQILENIKYQIFNEIKTMN